MYTGRFYTSFLIAAKQCAEGKGDRENAISGKQRADEACGRIYDTGDWDLFHGVDGEGGKSLCTGDGGRSA